MLAALPNRLNLKTYTFNSPLTPLPEWLVYVVIIFSILRVVVMKNILYGPLKEFKTNGAFWTCYCHKQFSDFGQYSF